MGAPSTRLSRSPQSAATATQPAADGTGAPVGAQPAIDGQEISKTFRITHSPITLKERVLHPFRRDEVEILEALRDVSFEVAEGEFFGIVGRNGSGKSTLLKVIAGIYRPNDGTIRVKGRLSPFIELGVGFNPELAARDNVVINCALLGLSRAEALRRFDGIVEFAGLERFVGLKLKNYSSGMQVRLAFSTAIQVDADILLLDEVLAVGDSEFQEKCFDTFHQMKADGRTIVLVTHNMSMIERFCDRAMLLDAGRLIAIGDPEDVTKTYRSDVRRQRAAADKPREGAPTGEGSAEVVEAWIEDASGRRVTTCLQGEQIRVCARVEFHSRIRSPEFGFAIRNDAGQVVIAANSGWDEFEARDFAPGERGTVALELANVLTVGRYTLDVAVAFQYGTTVADSRERATTFQVDGKRWTPGAVELPRRFSVEVDR